MPPYPNERGVPLLTMRYFYIPAGLSAEYARTCVSCIRSNSYPHPDRRSFHRRMYILFVITDPDSGCFPVTDHTAYGSIDLCPGGCHHHGDAGTRYSGCNGILLFGNSVSCHTELFIHSRIDNGDARDHGDVDKPRPCLSYCHIRRTIACIIQFTLYSIREIRSSSRLIRPGITRTSATSIPS